MILHKINKNKQGENASTLTYGTFETKSHSLIKIEWISPGKPRIKNFCQRKPPLTKKINRDTDSSGERIRRI